MKLSLIIDGNYLLNKHVFSLERDKILYGSLYSSVIKRVESFTRWYSFDEIYFISDTRTNWRKRIYPEYKKGRSKDTKIDWEFVHSTYKEIKDYFRETKHINVLESAEVEGDDWFYYLTNKMNQRGNSVLMLSSDSDLKQLITMNIKSSYFNMMCDLNSKIFVPSGYKTWLSKFSENMELPDIFDTHINEDTEFYNFFEEFISDRKIVRIEHSEILFEKIISGDRGDNIKSVYQQTLSNGLKRGIGVAGSKKLYDKYVELFGRPDFKEECFEKISDIIVEDKKLGDKEYSEIMTNIKFNNRLVNMNKIPEGILKKMKFQYEQTKS